MTQVSINKLRISFDLKILFLLIFTILSDVLFFKHPLGWTAGGFSLFFLALLTYYNEKALGGIWGKICIWSAFGQALVLVYQPNWLSASLYLLSIICLTFLGKGFESTNVFCWVRAFGQFFLSFIIKFFEEMGRFFKIKGRIKKRNRLSDILSRWTLPFALSAIFICLFAFANPIIKNWLQLVEISRLLPDVSIHRMVFWLFTAAIFTPFMKPPYVGRKTGSVPKPEKGKSWLFNKKSILNSLVIFNLIFSIQTASDLFYLWGGAGLPEGMTYAEYAQQGAYPLMVTALLAGAFVLIALRSHSDDSTTGWIKRLIYLWVGQNVFLVISSILRTSLYIEQYSLTYMRFAALVWMGLVALGLISIVVRIAQDRSNTWIINTNVIATLFVLYICSALNTGGIIANYNVRHCFEVTGRGAKIDGYYLNQIGTASLPAVIWLKENHKETYKSIEWVEPLLMSKLKDKMGNWRSWTFREYMLSPG